MEISNRIRFYYYISGVLANQQSGVCFVKSSKAILEKITGA